MNGNDIEQKKDAENSTPLLNLDEEEQEDFTELKSLEELESESSDRVELRYRASVIRWYVIHRFIYYTLNLRSKFRNLF